MLAIMRMLRGGASCGGLGVRSGDGGSARLRDRFRGAVFGCDVFGCDAFGCDAFDGDAFGCALLGVVAFLSDAMASAANVRAS